MHVAFEDIEAGNMSPETAMIRTQIYLTKQVKEAIERLSDERKLRDGWEQRLNRLRSE